MTSHGTLEWQAWILRAWHLAILRFAVTLEDADRLKVLAIANEIDRLGQLQADKSTFGFFRKTSSDLSAAILQPGKVADAIMRQYLARIDDARLKRALTEALGIEDREPVAAKRRFGPGADLWRGLPPRGSAQL